VEYLVSLAVVAVLEVGMVVQNRLVYYARNKFTAVEIFVEQNHAWKTGWTDFGDFLKLNMTLFWSENNIFFNSLKFNFEMTIFLLNTETEFRQNISM